MRRLLWPGVAVALAVAVAVAVWPTPEPPEFVSAEHKFRVRFGDVPTVSSTASDVVRTAVYSVATGAGAYQVVVADVELRADGPPDFATLVLAQAKADLLAAAGGVPVSDATATLAGKYPGSTFAANIQRPRPGVMRGRIYLVGNRLYEVLVQGTDAFATAPAATAFLDSFNVTQ